MHTDRRRRKRQTNQGKDDDEYRGSAKISPRATELLQRRRVA